MLALYPGTTSFHKARVKTLPVSNNDGYELLFKDEHGEYTVMMVLPQRFVLSCPSAELTPEEEGAMARKDDQMPKGKKMRKGGKVRKGGKMR